MAAPDGPASDAPRGRTKLRQLGWFILIWALSVTALGVVGWLIRLALKP
ncbi:DUF2474 domain-containing protein [Pseudonocardia sp. TMWB2A]